MRIEVFAHRGASFDCAEQSRESFQAAIAQGVDGIECDVRLTKDRVAFCWHDRDLKRLTGNPALISESLARDVTSMRIRDFGVENGRGELREGTPISFEELVVLAKDAQIPILAETKHPVRSGSAVEREIARLAQRYKVEIKILSFSFTAIRRAEELMPGIEHVQLLQHATLLPIASALYLGLDLELIHRDHEIVSTSQKRGKKVFVWTVNEDKDVELVGRLGVNGIITDKPARVRSLLGYA
jgi:glycerophosphoryl diester phosphodiesterase